MELLHPKEEEIMYTIWDIGRPCVISDILRANPELKRNTLAKGVITLEQKGYLTVDSIVKTATRTGRAYKPIIRKEDYDEQKKIMQTLVDSPNVQTGLLNYCSNLVDNKESNQELLHDIEKLLSNFQKNLN